MWDTLPWVAPRSPLSTAAQPGGVSSGRRRGGAGASPSSTLAPGGVPAGGRGDGSVAAGVKLCWPITLPPTPKDGDPRLWDLSPTWGGSPSVLGPSCCQLSPWTTAGRAPHLGWQPAPNLGARGHVPVWHHHPACRPSAGHHVSTGTHLGIVQGSAQAGYCKWSCQTALNHALASEIHVTDHLRSSCIVYWHLHMRKIHHV